MEHVTSFHDKYADSKRKRLGLKMEKDRLEENLKLGGKKTERKHNFHLDFGLVPYIYIFPSLLWPAEKIIQHEIKSISNSVPSLIVDLKPKTKRPGVAAVMDEDKN